jgi:hypothetical protein
MVARREPDEGLTCPRRASQESFWRIGRHSHKSHTIVSCERAAAEAMSPPEVRILRLQRLGLAAASLIFVTTGAAERTAHSGASDALVDFEASGPAGLKITGSTPELTETEDAGNITLTVALGKLTTGINLRDQHMRGKVSRSAQVPGPRR